MQSFFSYKNALEIDFPMKSIGNSNHTKNEQEIVSYKNGLEISFF